MGIKQDSYKAINDQLDANKINLEFFNKKRRELEDLYLLDHSQTYLDLNATGDIRIKEFDKQICIEKAQNKRRLALNFIKSLYFHYTPIPLFKEQVDFTFVVHCRYTQDHLDLFPFLNILKGIIPLRVISWIIKLCPPLIADDFSMNNNLKGKMITTLLLPKDLMSNRSRAEKEIKRIHRLVSKMSKRSNFKKIIGLGAWWPIVSVKGKLFNNIFNKRDYTVTTGHTVTVYSLVKTARQLIEQSGLTPQKTNIAILGCGNIGATCAEMLLKFGFELTLIDIYPKKLEKLKKSLLKKHPQAKIKNVEFSKLTIHEHLNQCHLGLCATSNMSKVLHSRDIPKHFIFIDDSRPEGIPRLPLSEEKYTLEGGLMNVKGASSSYNLGFGNDYNLLGCLSEAYFLALDSRHHRILSKTDDSIDEHKLWDFDLFCQLEKITVGEYKMGELILEPKLLSETLIKRNNSIIGKVS
jgi:predicted amino acid dehydrogenase